MTLTGNNSIIHLRLAPSKEPPQTLHGETFFTVLELKFQRNGLFLLDEPEAAPFSAASIGFSYAAP